MNSKMFAEEGAYMAMYAGQQDAQKPEKEQEGAAGEETEEVKKLLTLISEERREQMLVDMEEFCKRYDIKVQELAEALIKQVDNLKKAWEKIFENIKPKIECLVEVCRKCFSSIDKWELEKMKMSNNERRRRRMPMVRRRAHIRNTRKGRTRRRRK